MVEEFIKAREICWKVMSETENLIEEGRNILEIAEFIESKIFELGAKPAFPVNISVNEIAAHYTPEYNENYKLKKGDIVKIDIGAHINGYIADIAKTFCVNEKNEMIEIAEKCLKEALKVVEVGNEISEVGNVVEEIVKETNYKVVRNLCGHKISKFDLHAKPSIPNYKNFLNGKFEENNAYAIEIFLTNGNGWVKESGYSNIFQFNKDVAVRNEIARKILKVAKEEYETLPFAKRWIVKKFGETIAEIAINELVDKNGLIKHPILLESGNGLVVQAEDTKIL